MTVFTVLGSLMDSVRFGSIWLGRWSVSLFFFSKVLAEYAWFVHWLIQTILFLSILCSSCLLLSHNSSRDESVRPTSVRIKKAMVSEGLGGATDKEACPVCPLNNISQQHHFVARCLSSCVGNVWFTKEMRLFSFCPLASRRNAQAGPGYVRLGRKVLDKESPEGVP
jgi:hypothetical protein